MPSPSDITAEIIAKLRSLSRFDGFSIIMAFTPEILETEPEKPLIAVSAGKTEYTDAALGQGVKRGKFTVNISVYLPFYLGYDSGSMQGILSEILGCLLDAPVCAVTVSPAAADSATRCLLGGCSLTFTSLFKGGENDG